jgi:hypothetical protein
MPSNCPFKMVNKVNFILCVFSHNKKLVKNIIKSYSIPLPSKKNLREYLVGARHCVEHEMLKKKLRILNKILRILAVDTDS